MGLFGIRILPDKTRVSRLGSIQEANPDFSRV